MMCIVGGSFINCGLRGGENRVVNGGGDGAAGGMPLTMELEEE